jgi:hypothetical protein
MNIRLEWFVLWFDLFLYRNNKISYHGLYPDILLFEEWYPENDFRVIKRGNK